MYTKLAIAGTIITVPQFKFTGKGSKNIWIYVTVGTDGRTNKRTNQRTVGLSVGRWMSFGMILLARKFNDDKYHCGKSHLGKTPAAPLRH